MLHGSLLRYNPQYRRVRRALGSLGERRVGSFGGFGLGSVGGIGLGCVGACGLGSFGAIGLGSFGETMNGFHHRYNRQFPPNRCPLSSFGVAIVGFARRGETRVRSARALGSPPATTLGF